MTAQPEIALFLARADNGVVGADGDIPWKIPGEQRHFKELTMGKPMVMGRRTFESLPGLLPGRRHIVLTRDTDWSVPGAEVVHSVEEAISVADAPVIAVIGGAQVYRLFEPIAHRLEITEVHLAPLGDAIAAVVGAVNHHVDLGIGSSAAITTAGILLASILVTPDTAATWARIKFTLLFIASTAFAAASRATTGALVQAAVVTK